MQPAGPRSEWGRGLAAGFVGDNACIVPRALRCRRPQAAGVYARPTMQPGTGDNAEATVCRQAQRRAMLTLSRGLCGAASLGGPMKIIGPCAGDSGAPQPPSTCHARRPGYAAHLPYIVGRAFTPAGEGKGVTLRFCVSAAPRGPVMPQGREGLR